MAAINFLSISGYGANELSRMRRGPESRRMRNKQQHQQEWLLLLKKIPVSIKSILLSVSRYRANELSRKRRGSESRRVRNKHNDGGSCC